MAVSDRQTTEACAKTLGQAFWLYLTYIFISFQICKIKLSGYKELLPICLLRLFHGCIIIIKLSLLITVSIYVVTQIFREMQILRPPLSFSGCFLKSANHNVVVMIKRLFTDTMFLSKLPSIFRYDQLFHFLYNFSYSKWNPGFH